MQGAIDQAKTVPPPASDPEGPVFLPFSVLLDGSLAPSPELVKEQMFKSSRLVSDRASFEESRRGTHTEEVSEGELATAGGRAATEAALEEAALSLLQRDGILAGLNLREVADEAGVNRGLVYHYYGSRGKLLRQALRHRGEKAMQQIVSLEHSRFAHRQLQFLRTLIDNAESVRLRTLLLLDRTERIRMMPLRDQVQARLRHAVDSGEIDPDLDLRSLHAFVVSSVYGYVLYREPFAAELGIEVSELDDRFSELYERIILSLAPPRRPRGARRAPDAPAK